ncbi:ArdC family protein [Desulfovirgula thermocuniculi]|uniref:ArdC family protein n=1 Tax=Desulfovirgula thermocuniculi TaxID=348842 RepID=UPI00040EE53C|nr:ArdC family protein [Desulfovirgula thermocuniculi]
MSVKLENLKKSRDQKVRELYNRLVEGVRAVLDRADWKAYLDMLARFHKYSPANVALILAQYPKATRVAGIKTWNSLGRRVKPGEKGIRIFAPTLVRVRVQVEETDPETGEVRVVEREEERLAGFHVTHVWDVSQTEGKPLPEPPEFTGRVSGGEAARRVWDRLLTTCPFPVAWGVTTPGAKGEFNPRTGEIRLDPTLDEGLRTKVLLHEVAHGLAYRLGLDGTQFYLTLGRKVAYQRGEAIAEGAAYIAAAHFGMDTGGYCFEYVADWVRDAEKLLEWGEAVQKVARALIELVENAGEKAA